MPIEIRVEELRHRLHIESAVCEGAKNAVNVLQNQKNFDKKALQQVIWLWVLWNHEKKIKPIRKNSKGSNETQWEPWTYFTAEPVMAEGIEKKFHKNPKPWKVSQHELIRLAKTGTDYRPTWSETYGLPGLIGHRTGPAKTRFTVVAKFPWQKPKIHQRTINEQFKDLHSPWRWSVKYWLNCLLATMQSYFLSVSGFARVWLTWVGDQRRAVFKKFIVNFKFRFFFVFRPKRRNYGRFEIG